MLGRYGITVAPPNKYTACKGVPRLALLYKFTIELCYASEPLLGQSEGIYCGLLL